MTISDRAGEGAKWGAVSGWLGSFMLLARHVKDPKAQASIMVGMLVYSALGAAVGAVGGAAYGVGENMYASFFGTPENPPAAQPQQPQQAQQLHLHQA